MAKLKAPEAVSGLVIEQIAPAGQHLAVCLRVNDVFGVERMKFQSTEMEMRDVTRFIFGIKDATGNLLFIQTFEYTISGAPGSNLIKFLTQWLGTAPQMGWDYAEMIGRGAMLTVQHKQSRKNPGQTYADIAGIAPVFPQLLAQVPPASDFEAKLSAMEKGGSSSPASAPARHSAPPPPAPAPTSTRQLSPDGKFELVNNQWVPVTAAPPPPPPPAPAPAAPPPPPPPAPANPPQLSPDGKWQLVNNAWVPYAGASAAAPAGTTNMDEDMPF